MPAITRITCFRAVSKPSRPIADSTHHIPVLPHDYKEYDVPLLMTVPDACGAESFDRLDDLITHAIRMKDGFAYPHDGPGWGFSFKEDTLKEIAAFGQ